MTDSRFNTAFELGLLALVALIAGVMAGLSIHANDSSGAAAWSALLMAIINTVKEARQGRTIDRMGASLANAPAADPATPPGAQP